MLTKLIKHEMLHWVRTFSIFYIIYAIVAVITKILITVEMSYGDNYEEHIFTTILLAIFGFVMMLFSIMMPWISLAHNSNRFKKNMFSDEGYLTNTLPVTPAEHIGAKLIMGGISYVCTCLLIFVCILLLIAGVDQEYIEMNFVFDEMQDFTMQNFGEMMLGFLLSVSVFVGILLLCYLAEGLAAINGGKKAIASGVAILGVVLAMIISSAIATVLRANGVEYDSNARVVAQIIFYLVAEVGMFFLISYILKNKLNLE